MHGHRSLDQIPKLDQLRSCSWDFWVTWHCPRGGLQARHQGQLLSIRVTYTAVNGGGKPKRLAGKPVIREKNEADFVSRGRRERCYGDWQTDRKIFLPEDLRVSMRPTVSSCRWGSVASPESLQELPFTSVGFCNVYTNHVRVTDPHTEVTSCCDLKEVPPEDSLCKPVRKTLKSQTGAPSVSVYFCLVCPRLQIWFWGVAVKEDEECFCKRVKFFCNLTCLPFCWFFLTIKNH